jgi:hypothetical protein
MSGRQFQRELESAKHRLLDRIEDRVTWGAGMLIYSWFNFEFIDSWVTMVAKHQWLNDWSHSDLLGGIVQFGSLGIALLIGKIIARLLLIDLDKLP